MAVVNVWIHMRMIDIFRKAFLIWSSPATGVTIWLYLLNRVTNQLWALGSFVILVGIELLNQSSYSLNQFTCVREGIDIAYYWANEKMVDSFTTCVSSSLANQVLSSHIQLLTLKNFDLNVYLIATNRWVIWVVNYIKESFLLPPCNIIEIVN